MKNRHFPIVLLSISCLYACASDEHYYLRNRYELIADRVSEEKITGSAVAGSDSYDAMMILPCDTLCLFFSWKNPKGFFSILDLSSGRELGTYCPKGHGPQETTGMGPISEVCKDRGAMKAEIYDVHRQRIFVWNITESLKSGITVYDTIRPLESRDGYESPYLWRFRIDDSLYFTCRSATAFELEGRIVIPEYALTSASDHTTIRKYHLFADSVISVTGKRKWILSDFVSMDCCMKPDKSKVALGMSSYPQLNILDLKSGELKCFRLRGTPSVSISKRIWYYASVCCDDRHIYGLYNAQDLSLPGTGNSKSVVHVFDWEGRLVRKLVLGEHFDQICLNRNAIYAFDRRGKIVRYDVDEDR